MRHLCASRNQPVRATALPSPWRQPRDRVVRQPQPRPGAALRHSKRSRPAPTYSPYDVESPASDPNLDVLCRPQGGLALSSRIVSPGLRLGATGPVAPRGLACDRAEARDLPQCRASREDLVGRGRGTRPAAMPRVARGPRQVSYLDHALHAPAPPYQTASVSDPPMSDT